MDAPLDHRSRSWERRGPPRLSKASLDQRAWVRQGAVPPNRSATTSRGRPGGLRAGRGHSGRLSATPSRAARARPPTRQPARRRSGCAPHRARRHDRRVRPARTAGPHLTGGCRGSCARLQARSCLDQSPRCLVPRRDVRRGLSRRAPRARRVPTTPGQSRRAGRAGDTPGHPVTAFEALVDLPCRHCGRTIPSWRRIPSAIAMTGHDE